MEPIPVRAKRCRIGRYQVVGEGPIDLPAGWPPEHFVNVDVLVEERRGDDEHPLSARSNAPGRS